MFKTIRPDAVDENVFALLEKGSLLVSANLGDGSQGRSETAVVPCASLGVLWNRPVATVYVRQGRFMNEILEGAETFSVSVLPEGQFLGAVKYLEIHNGNEEGKLHAAKLSLQYMNGTPWIEQAHLVLFCSKIYSHTFEDEGFSDQRILSQHYKKNDFHTMYIGEITKVISDSRK